MALIIIPARRTDKAMAEFLRYLVANAIFNTMRHDSSSSKLNQYLLVELKFSISV